MANETRGVSAVHGIAACDAEEIGEKLGSAMARALRAEDYGKFFRLEDEFDDYADSLLVVAFDDPEL